jgi:hypothetical protein
LQILKFPVVFTGAIHPNYPNPPEGVLGWRMQKKMRTL